MWSMKAPVAEVAVVPGPIGCPNRGYMARARLGCKDYRITN